MILINFNDNMEVSEITDLEKRFNAERDHFPPLCIVTSYDQPHYGNIWSSAEQRNPFVLACVTLLARQCLEYLERSLIYSAQFIKPSRLFTPSSEGYHLIIQIKSDNVANTLAHDFGSAFVEYSEPNWHLSLAGTNFLKTAVEPLREAYSEYAAFFYNTCGGKEIAVIWKPGVFENKEFKVTDVQACSLTSAGKRMQVNQGVLIEDFKFILKDFYLRIGSVESVREACCISFTKPTTKRYFDCQAMDGIEQRKVISTTFAKFQRTF